MKIIDFMKKNSDKTFLFLLYEGITVGDDIKLVPNEEISYFFEGYDAFVNFKSDNKVLYRRVYKPMLNCEIGTEVEPYYLNDSSILFCSMRHEDQCYWARKAFFETCPRMLEYLNARAQECTCDAQKVG